MAIELNANKLEVDKVSGTIFDPETGEIIDGTISNVKFMIENKRKEDAVNKAKVKELKLIAGIEDPKYTNWKSGKKVQFIKIYRTEMREYKRTIKLSSGATALAFYIIDYIELNTNRVAKPNGESFTNNELQDLTGLSDKPLRNAFSELEEKHFIRRVGQGKAREIYFNPYLACSGISIRKDIVNLFNDYIPCTEY